MTKTVKTKGIGDKGNIQYAGVADRLKEFREDNPRASIKTSSTNNEDGSVKFETYILKDKSDEFSADATGSAQYNANEMKNPKAFEKLETISVGRALALLGYLNNGEIATSEEMEEFEDYKNKLKEQAIQEAIDRLEDAKSMDELRSVFSSLGNLMSNDKIITTKDLMKLKLEKESK